MATSTDLVADKATALRLAQQMGCSGAHQHPDGKWMPCSTMAEYEKLKADSGKNTVAIVEQRRRYRSAKGKNKRNGWEHLGERGPTSIDTITGGGLTGGRSGSIKAAGGWAPDDEDPDVFTNARSARRRARQLGCIGIARRTSRNGKIVWTPCSNMTDYAKRTGSTAFGRHHQRRRARRTLERAVAREVRRQLRRKKSLMEELYEGKALGRKLRVAASRFDPNAVDADMDMLVQEGTPWERPARPKIPGSRRAERMADRIERQRSLAKKPRSRGLASRANSAEELREETLSKVKRRDNSEKTIHWVFGTPGSGKSTLVRTGDLKAPPPDEAAHVDPDDYKQFHPRWNSGTGARETHPWSVGQAERTMKEADEAGMDLVVQGTGKNGPLINQFVQEGGDYRNGRRKDVTSVAHLVYAPQVESERRLHDRGQRRGHDDQRARLTGTLRDRAEIQEKMARYITEGRFDETHIYDNSGVEGAATPLIAAQRADGTYEILDQEKFEDFFGNPETAAQVEEYWKSLGDSRESLGNTFRRTREAEGLKSRINDSFEDKYRKEAPNGKGDCFPAALLAGRDLEAGSTDNNGNLVSNIRVVNGSPLGVGGDAEGLRFPHAWIEYDVELPPPPELPEDLLDRVPEDMREEFAALIRQQNELAEAVRTQMADRGKVTMVRDFSNVKKDKNGLPISFQKMDRKKLTSMRPDFMKEDYYRDGSIREGDILGQFTLDEYEALTDQYGMQHFSQQEAAELLEELQD